MVNTVKDSVSLESMLCHSLEKEQKGSDLEPLNDNVRVAQGTNVNYWALDFQSGNGLEIRRIINNDVQIDSSSTAVMEKYHSSVAGKHNPFSACNVNVMSNKFQGKRGQKTTKCEAADLLKYNGRSVSHSFVSHTNKYDCEEKIPEKLIDIQKAVDEMDVTNDFGCYSKGGFISSNEWTQMDEKETSKKNVLQTNKNRRRSMTISGKNHGFDSNNHEGSRNGLCDCSNEGERFASDNNAENQLNGTINKQDVESCDGVIINGSQTILSEKSLGTNTGFGSDLIMKSNEIGDATKGLHGFHGNNSDRTAIQNSELTFDAEINGQSTINKVDVLGNNGESEKINNEISTIKQKDECSDNPERSIVRRGRKKKRKQSIGCSKVGPNELKSFERNKSKSIKAIPAERDYDSVCEVMKRAIDWFNEHGLIPIIHALPFREEDREALEKYLLFSICRNNSWIYSVCNPHCEGNKPENDDYADYINLPISYRSEVQGDESHHHPTTKLGSEALSRLYHSISGTDAGLFSANVEGVGVFLRQDKEEGRLVAAGIAEYLGEGEAILHSVFGPRELGSIDIEQYSNVNGSKRERIDSESQSNKRRKSRNGEKAINETLLLPFSTQLYYFLISLTFCAATIQQVRSTEAKEPVLTIWEKDTCFMPKDVWNILTEILYSSRHFEPHNKNECPIGLKHIDEIQRKGERVKYESRTARCCNTYHCQAKGRKTKYRVDGYIERFLCVSWKKFYLKYCGLQESLQRGDNKSKSIKYAHWIKCLETPLVPPYIDWQSLCDAKLKE